MKLYDYKLSVIRMLTRHYSWKTEKAAEWVMNHPEYVVAMWESDSHPVATASNIAEMEKIEHADELLQQENSGITDSWTET